MPPSDPAFVDLRPRRSLDHETGPEGRVVVLRPKILSPRWSWLLRLLRKRNYRVRLDERGSFVWLLCDGSRSIAEVTAETQRQFGDPAKDSGERTTVFLRELARGGFLVFDPPDGHES